MKIKCNKTDLMSGINIAMKGVASKSTQPILECLLLDCENGQLKLMSNDLEMGIKTVIPGEISENGVIAIDAKLFSQVVNKLPDGEISISSDGSEAVIKSGKAKFKLACRDGNDFVNLPEVNKEKFITLNQYSLREAIRQTIFAISDDNSNKMMRGVCFEVKGDKLQLTALDGHRIAIRYIDLQSEYDNIKVVIPGKTLNEISKILSDGGNVNLYFTDKHILIEFGSSVVVSRLIEGEYFDIDRMLASDYNTCLKIDRRGLVEGLERASLLVTNDKKPVVFEIDDTLTIQLITALGAMNEQMDIEREGEPTKIGFNARYILDALKSIDDEVATMNLINPKSPCCIEGADYKYVVLPVSIDR